jgi:hypothetical protein
MLIFTVFQLHLHEVLTVNFTVKWIDYFDVVHPCFVDTIKLHGASLP